MATKPVIYVETSVISYLTARPSRLAAVAERQRITLEWWDRRKEFRLVTSEVVMDEVSRGAKAWAEKRLRIIGEFGWINFSPEQADDLADRLIRGGSLPAAARDDALHVAVATIGGADYLLTWNLKHLANPTIRTRAEKLIRLAGLKPAIMRTPEELLRMMS